MAKSKTDKGQTQQPEVIEPEQDEQQLGRPSTTVLQKLRNIVFDYDKMYQLACRGFTDQELADILGVSLSTFKNWKRADETFFALLKEGKNVADTAVEASLFQSAIGYSHKAVKFFVIDGAVVSQEYIEHYPPNPTSMVFWLKNRQPKKWRDKVDVEHAVAGKGRVRLGYGPDKEDE